MIDLCLKKKTLLNTKLEGQIAAFHKEITLLNKAKDEIDSTLKLERENAKEQLKTINNVEKWRVNTERDVKNMKNMLTILKTLSIN